MFSHGQFIKPSDDFRLRLTFEHVQGVRDFADGFSELVRQHNVEVRIMADGFPGNLSRLPHDRRILAVIDQGVNFPVVAVSKEEDLTALREAASSGMILGVTFLEYPTGLASEIVRALWALPGCDCKILPPPTIIDLTPSAGSSGLERWELFPDLDEQRRLRDTDPKELAGMLWSSGRFIFGNALCDMSVNLGHERSLAVCEEALRLFPGDREAILAEMKSTVGVMAWYSTPEGAAEGRYTELQRTRMEGLVQGLRKILDREVR